jgi:hypothetical protein
MENKQRALECTYNFIFEDNSSESFSIKLNAESLDFIENENSKPPVWAKLEHHQCENCKLKSSTHPHCPIAKNLTEIFPPFKDRVSYENVLVRVKTKERTYELNTSVQKGLSSLLGILMVTSGCPAMNILRPMVRFHLPFATIDETVYRSASSYLLGQFYRYKNGKSVDWYMKDLSKAYESIQIVNIGMAQRLRSISDQDAGANAVIVLDIFAKELPYSILDGLKKLEYLYKDFIEIDSY